MVNRIALIAAILLGAALPVPAVAAEPVTAVVELFTSQGCSSCPPADRLLGKLAEENGILALSYSVDYWDYLGWADTLGSPENSARQKDYAAVRGDRAVYTPQVVVNGRVHEIGSDEVAVRRAITNHQSGPGGLAVPIELATSAEELTVSIPKTATSGGVDATLWLVTFEKSRTVAIKRGENRDREVTYHHVVRILQPIGMWKGEATTLTLPKAELMRDGADGCAVLLQEHVGSKPGAILGAAVLNDL